ncbi:hypothetical protein ACOMHN_024862 [Nucella lapillus]
MRAMTIITVTILVVIFKLVAVCSSEPCISRFRQQCSSALQWTNQAQGQAGIQTCEGSNITFPWRFSLDPGEDVEDIKWLYTPSAGTADLMANYVYRHFMPVGPYVNCVKNVGNGTIELARVTAKDSGQYEIEVAVRQGNQFFTMRQGALLQVGHGPLSVAPFSATPGYCCPILRYPRLLLSHSPLPQVIVPFSATPGQQIAGGQQIVVIKTKYADNYYNMATGHAVLRLQQGQIVNVKPDHSLSMSGESFQSDLSFFSGFLVSSVC